MVNAEMPAAAVPVKNGRKVRKIAVEVDTLGICTSAGPTVQQVSLEHLHSKSYFKALEGATLTTMKVKAEDQTQVEGRTCTTPLILLLTYRQDHVSVM